MQWKLSHILVVFLVVSLLAMGVHIAAYRLAAQSYRTAATLSGAAALYAEQCALVVRGSIQETIVPAQKEAAEEEAEAVPQKETGAADQKEKMAQETEAKMDFAALRAVNSEVQGWLWIPGSAVSYPLLQGTDNAYYLSHTWDGAYSTVGAIFLDAACAPDLSGAHTIIYGHNMRDGSMFASLLRYRRQSYWASHPSITLVNDAGMQQYMVFAAYEAAVAGDTYCVTFADDAEKMDYLRCCLDSSVIQCGLEPDVSAQILTLSTCTGRGYQTRWVVQAVRCE